MATYRPRNTTFRLLTGVEECDAMLMATQRLVANRAARSTMTKAVRLTVKKIKAKVPSAQKSIRKAIGGNVKRRRGGADRGIVTAKAGAAVGKKQQNNREPRKSGGVGIGPENVHWYILGTDERTVDATGQRAGRMPAHPIVKDAMSSGGGEVIALIRRDLPQSLEREIAKEAAKRLKTSKRGR